LKRGPLPCLKGEILVQKKTQYAGKKIVASRRKPVTPSRGIIQNKHDKRTSKGIDNSYQDKFKKGNIKQETMR
jgi:hypothetical protein